MQGFRFLSVLSGVLALSVPVWAQLGPAAIDSDADTLNDALEQRLLQQFLPDFRVGAADCAGLPASFRPGVVEPTVQAVDGTVYGQVSRHASTDPAHPAVEVHYYHLWSVDCGGHGHPLDAEHVAVLLEASDKDVDTAAWKARYWYAAAHENTVCDASEVASAATLRAEAHGPIVWVSPGKHASYFDESLCSHGCGADRCLEMKSLRRGTVRNLGEVRRPMNGSDFTASSRWPLQAKMEQTNFSPATLARLQELPENRIALFNAGRHPAQGVIAISASTEQAIAGSGQDTTDAVSLAGAKTGNALQRSLRHTTKALSRSAAAVGKAVGVKSGDHQGANPAH